MKKKIKNYKFKKSLENKEELMLYYKLCKNKMTGKLNKIIYQLLFHYYKIIKKINNNLSFQVDILNYKTISMLK